MTRTERLLCTLATDDSRRAGIVEDLRCAAALLDGSPPESAFPVEIRTQAAFKTACRLRDLAGLLCDHPGGASPGQCRYCGLRVLG